MKARRKKPCIHGTPTYLKCERCKTIRNIKAKQRRREKKKTATALDKMDHAREMMQTWARKLRLATTTHRKWERKFNALERQAAIEKAVAAVTQANSTRRAIQFEDVK